MKKHFITSWPGAQVKCVFGDNQEKILLLSIKTYSVGAH